MSQKTIQTNSSVNLWTEQSGKGEPVLLISGANASAFMWPGAFVRMIVDQGYRVVRYDHRDTGRSDRMDFQKNPYSVADLCDDAVAVLDGLNIEKAHVVGLSLGGTIGQVLALDHPHRLISLTVMMTAALDVDFAANWMAAMKGKATQGDLPGPVPEVVTAFKAPLADRSAEIARRVEQWRILSSPRMPFDSDDYAAREAADIDHSGSIPAPFAHAMAQPIPLERGLELKTSGVPTLVIQAADDPLNPPPHGRHIADLFGNAILVEMDGLGHALPRSHFAEILSTFVRHWKDAATGNLTPAAATHPAPSP
ncbi:MAG: alpha/beta hydrolase [Gammaproteobacteria bacterium]|nr:MAG: alpha/beta hydrolase [Gammaproteobacteria bacterium]